MEKLKFKPVMAVYYTRTGLTIRILTDTHMEINSGAQYQILQLH
jgi:hypothetical protein